MAAGMVGCNPNSPPRVPQPPVVEARQPAAPREIPAENQAREIPPSNPDYGYQTSEIGIPVQVEEAKKNSGQAGPNPELEIDRDQFQFGTTVGAGQDSSS